MVRHTQGMPRTTTEPTMTAREARTARNQEPNLAAFPAKKAELDALLAELTRASEDTFGADPETVLWGAPARLSDATAKLKDIADQHFRRSEYAARRRPPPDSQRVILSAAAQHEMGLAPAPKTLPAAALNAMFRNLIKANLLTEINAPREHVGLGWRQHEDGIWIVARITDEGLRAIGTDPSGGDAPEENEQRSEAIARRNAERCAPWKPQEGTKQEQVLAMLRREEGATVAQIAEGRRTAPLGSNSLPPRPAAPTAWTALRSRSVPPATGRRSTPGWTTPPGRLRRRRADTLQTPLDLPGAGRSARDDAPRRTTQRGGD